MRRLALLVFAVFVSACPAGEAKVERIDARTVTFLEILPPPIRPVIRDEAKPAPAPRRVRWPSKQLAILPGAKPLQVGEVVQIDKHGAKILIVRRPENIAAWKEEELAFAADAMPGDRRASVRRAIAERKAILDAMTGEVYADDPRQGQVGRFVQSGPGKRFSKGNVFKILQVAGENAVRLAPYYDTDKDFWLDGYSTTGLSDGRQLLLAGVFEVAGTKSYRTPIGAMRTIPRIVPWKNKAAASDGDREELTKLERSLDLDGKLQKDLDDQLKALADPPKPAEKADRQEAVAVLRLRLAKRLTSEASRDEKMERLEAIVRDFPDTKAAAEARKLLSEMKKK